MSDILCDCGHSVDLHNSIWGCNYDSDMTEIPNMCPCRKTDTEVRHIHCSTEIKNLCDLVELLFDEMWELLTDGDDPDLEKIKVKLTELGFDVEKMTHGYGI